MTDDELKKLPLAQRLMVAKMRDYDWEYEHHIYWSIPNDVMLTFRKHGWGASIAPADGGGFLVTLGGDNKRKPFFVKTAEAACLQLEIRYRKKMEQAGKKL